jgi:hypothetical protein
VVAIPAGAPPTASCRSATPTSSSSRSSTRPRPRRARSGAGSAAARATGARPFGWAVRTGDIRSVARRLGLTVADGSRAGRDGRRLRWRLAGIEQAAAEPSLPFFIEWGPGTPLPGRATADHAAGPVRLARLELDGDADRIATWLGGHQLPISVRPGAPAVGRVVLAGAAGETVI